MERPLVSVIVPYYRNGSDASVERCIAALERQDYPRSRFEIILVNNGSEADHACLAHKFSAITVAHQSLPGSYSARNRGVELALGEVLAFTDADCIPAIDWITRGVAALSNGDERVAGRIELTFQGNVLTIAERYEKAFSFPQAEYVKAGYSVTANLIVWSRIFHEVGPFVSIFSGGDHEWGLRASDAGIKIAYRPDVIVAHPARASISELLKKSRRVAGGVTQIDGAKDQWVTANTVLRGFMPPLPMWTRLFKRTELSWADKFASGKLFYVLKVHRNLYQIAFKAGMIQAKRE